MVCGGFGFEKRTIDTYFYIRTIQHTCTLAARRLRGSSLFAAASTTAANHAHYGHANDDNDVVVDLLNDDRGSDFTPPNKDADSDSTGTNIDDDDYVNIDSVLEDETRSSFLMNKNLSMNTIIGGDQY